MVRVNFFGDFKCNDVSKLNLDASLTQLLDCGDVNVLNFEAPIRELDSQPIEKSGPNITNDPNAPGFLVNAGFNLFSLANNHIFDYGPESLYLTRRAFPMGQAIGAGNWNEAYSPAIINIADKKIGFIAVTHHEFGVLYEKSYHEQLVGAAWMLHPMIDELIIDTKQRCDYVFVLAHCGMEHEFFPMPEVRTIYHHWVNMGADGVFASHPHTPQPWEQFKGKPIVYSLGNFCFDALSRNIPEYWYWSLILSLEIEDNIINPKVLYCHYNEEEGNLKLKDNNIDFNDHFNHIMKVISNEEDYMQHINAQCLKYSRHYERFLNISGFYKLTPQIIIRQIAKYLLGKNRNSKLAPLKNCFKCETHRWTFTRIMDMQ